MLKKLPTFTVQDKLRTIKYINQDITPNILINSAHPFGELLEMLEILILILITLCQKHHFYKLQFRNSKQKRHMFHTRYINLIDSTCI